jgi:hypothetical protein
MDRDKDDRIGVALGTFQNMAGMQDPDLIDDLQHLFGTPEQILHHAGGAAIKVGNDVVRR